MSTMVEESRKQDMPWLKSYAPGVPATIDPSRYSSVREIFAESCKRFAALPAFTNMGKTISYAELDALSRDFGAWLQARGLKRGDRVAIMMPNLLQYPVALFGVLQIGR